MCSDKTANGGIQHLADDALGAYCERVRIECKSITQDNITLCDTDPVIKDSCKYTCDNCNFSSTIHAFTVAELIDAVLNTMPLSYAAPLGVGNILRFTPMAVVNVKHKNKSPFPS